MTSESKERAGDLAAMEGKGCLYVVATPIGNLGDITLRAIDILKQVQLIACEDTRVTGVLCRHFGISTALTAYHDHNGERVLPVLLAKLEAGQSVALVSDAGTPLISDPGYRLVVEARKAGIPVIPVPGASSILCALSAAGLPTDRFYMGGFLPHKQQARRQVLSALMQIDATLVLLESNHRLAESLQDMVMVLGVERQAVIAREMTKRFEEFRAGCLGELAAYYQAYPDVKGEIVIVLEPPAKQQAGLAEVRPLMEALLPHYPLKQAASLIAEATGIDRKRLYQLGLEVRDAASS